MVGIVAASAGSSATTGACGGSGAVAMGYRPGVAWFWSLPHLEFLDPRISRRPVEARRARHVPPPVRGRHPPEPERRPQHREVVGEMNRAPLDGRGGHGLGVQDASPPRA